MLETSFKCFGQEAFTRLKGKKEDRGEVFSKDTIGYNKTLQPSSRSPPLCPPDSPHWTCAKIFFFFFNSIKHQTSQEFIPTSFSCFNFWQWETWLWAHDLGWICLLKHKTYLKSFRTNYTVRIKLIRVLETSSVFSPMYPVKAFDCVNHNKLWKILKEMGISDHLTCRLRNLYMEPFHSV